MLRKSTLRVDAFSDVSAWAVRRTPDRVRWHRTGSTSLGASFTQCLKTGPLCKHRHRYGSILPAKFRAIPHFVLMQSPLLLRGRCAAHLTGIDGTGPAAERSELVFVLGSNTRIQELRWSFSAGDTSRVLATETVQALVVTTRVFFCMGMM